MTREDALQTSPALSRALTKLAGRITPDAIRKMNYAVDGEKKTPRAVAAAWLKTLYTTAVKTS
jgi:glycine betaine/choline ABC-type transport system substrate-binding protein